VSEIIETYHLGDIKVEITDPGSGRKYTVHCTKGENEITFKVSPEEYKGYKKLMNKRIKREFVAL